MKPWKTLARATILDRGKFLKVENHIVEVPDGTVIDSFRVNLISLAPEIFLLLN